MEITRAQRVPPIRWNGGPTIDGMFGDSGEADDGAMIEPLLPVAHVRHDFCDRMWKGVRFRVRLVLGEAVKDRARREMDAFTAEHAGQ